MKQALFLYLDRHHTKLILFFLAIIILRACALSLPALIDPTEARYASMAQHMVISGQWLVPEINRGDGFVPFWAKPPLHFWLTALCLKAFGFSEFAARLPSLLAAIGIVILAAAFAKRHFPSNTTVLTAGLLATTPFFFFLSGICIVDLTFTFFLTLALVSFSFFAKEPCHHKIWSHIFFAALALGFLTKGPLILALVSISLSLWFFATRNWGIVRSIPWGWGLVIFTVIASPWFIMAEAASPGLNQYFFVNENVSRFISPQYVDLYGSSHRTFRGVIVLYTILGTLPWSLLPLLLFFKRRRYENAIQSQQKESPQNSFPSSPQNNEWFIYAIIWGLTPALFFIASNNVLISYILPGLPGIMLAIAYDISRSAKHLVVLQALIDPLHHLTKALTLITVIVIAMLPQSTIFLLLLCGIFFLLLYSGRYFAQSHRKHGQIPVFVSAVTAIFLLSLVIASPTLSDLLSTKTILEKIDKEEDKHELVSFQDKLPFSAIFYLQSDGHLAKMPQLLKKGEPLPDGDLIVRSSDLNSLYGRYGRNLYCEEQSASWTIVDPLPHEAEL